MVDEKLKPITDDEARLRENLLRVTKDDRALLWQLVQEIPRLLDERERLLAIVATAQWRRAIGKQLNEVSKIPTPAARQRQVELVRDHFAASQAEDAALAQEEATR